MTSPPRPPLPPSGPPSGLNFSRCTEEQPWPPSPAATCSTTSSTNVVKAASSSVSSSGCRKASRAGRKPGPALAKVCREGLLGRLRDDVDDLSATAAAELDRTRAEREQRVVATPADVQPRVEVGAALAHDDLAGVDQLTAEALDAEALGVGVASVASGGRALLVCHLVLPLTSCCRCRCP